MLRWKQEEVHFLFAFLISLQQSTGRLTTNVHLRLVLCLYMYDYYQSSSDYGWNKRGQGSPDQLPTSPWGICRNRPKWFFLWNPKVGWQVKATRSDFSGWGSGTSWLVDSLSDGNIPLFHPKSCLVGRCPDELPCVSIWLSGCQELRQTWLGVQQVIDLHRK